MEISKELLSNIIGKHTKDFVIEKNELRYILEDDENSIPELYYINIYELAHKCKEWAYNQGYTIDIYNKNDGLYIEVSKHILGRYLYKSLLFDLNDEQNELIKACQWILDNKEL